MDNNFLHCILVKVDFLFQTISVLKFYSRIIKEITFSRVPSPFPFSTIFAQSSYLNPQALCISYINLKFHLNLSKMNFQYKRFHIDIKKKQKKRKWICCWRNAIAIWIESNKIRSSWWGYLLNCENIVGRQSWDDGGNGPPPQHHPPKQTLNKFFMNTFLKWKWKLEKPLLFK